MTMVIGFIVFEFIKHVIFPLFWYIKNRKKRSICSVTSMLGKVAEVKQWQTSEGRVFVNGELWRAVAALNIQHTTSDVAEYVSLSLGVATLLPDQKMSPVDLIKAADKALYQAKANGRNCVINSLAQIKK